MSESPVAVVPVAGRGSRLAPLTTVVPKELFPVGRLPVLHRVVQELVAAGMPRIVLVTSLDKPSLREYVDQVLVPSVCAPVGVEVSLVIQGPVAGNGGAILSAAEHVGEEHLLVVWGDEVFLGESRTGQLLACHAETAAPCLAVVDVADADVSRCGILVPGGVRGPYVRVAGIVEKPRPQDVASRMASVGGFVLDGAVLDVLRRTPPGPDGELYLSHALSRYAAEHELLGCRLRSEWYETGSPEGYARAFAAVARADGLFDDASERAPDRVGG